MPVFTYKARDKFGTLITGKKEDESIENVRKFLASRNYFVVSIKEEKTKLRWLKLSNKRVSSNEIFLFFRQFSVLIKAGITVIASLESIAKQMKNEYFQGILYNIIEKIKTGDSLSNAMRLYPDIFAYTYVNMIEAAELSGQLEQVLDRITILMQKSEHTKANIKTALTYPIIIFSVAVLIVSFILIFILPKFVAIYNKRLIELPLPTQILIIASNILSNYWYFIILTILLSILFLQKLLKNNET
ncbi:MAG TPA: type II secretion system F family protein, partial [bacterium]|nr:type II secretion system F family protein [bacterium]